MKNQSGSICLCLIMLIACASIYWVAHYGCTYDDDSSIEKPKIESVKLNEDHLEFADFIDETKTKENKNSSLTHGEIG